MNKLKNLQGTQDFMKRNKSTKEMLQEQQRQLKRGLLGRAEKPTINKAMMSRGIPKKEEKPSIREEKIKSLQQQQKELKKKKPLKFLDFY